MTRVRVFALMLALLPATLAAQRGGGGRGSRSSGQSDASRSGSGNIEGIKLSNGDVEDISPIKLLIDKRKDLKLTDAQVKQFKGLENEMKKRNENLFKQLDSLRKAASISGRPTDDERSRMMSARRDVVDVVGNIRLSYNETLKQATPLLDDTQKPKADALVQQQNEEAEKMLREKLSSRGDRDPGSP
ncbi:MAG: hypothetical protein ACREPM_19365 [Gemmatimonadaceae bacterium]